MINSFEIYITYCMALVTMAAFRIRLDVTRISVRKASRGFASTTAFTRNTENLGILASSLYSSILTILPYSGKQDISRFFGLQSGLISVKDILIANFHKLIAIYEGALNRLKLAKTSKSSSIGRIGRLF
jgi:hypothetical protein